MSPTATMAAVILAAGTSSRMGKSKPLLTLGAGSVIERAIRTVTRAGVDDIVVVTGHRADELVPVLDKLGVAHVYNPAYETGMFSSVRAGVGALKGRVDAFFVLPVDCALIRSETLRRLIHSHQETTAGILHPTCCGLRGHPPLISARYREALAQAGEGDDLRSFLQRHHDDELEVEVEDLTILMDMDTSEDYQRLRRFAEIRDAAEDGSRTGPASLGPDDALYLLSLLWVPDRVVRHSQIVAAVGMALAAALKDRVPALDAPLVRSGCLLHDMAKGKRRHAAVGQTLLDNLGLHRLGSLVGSHMVISPQQLDAPLPTEEQLVYLADKLVAEDEVTSLEERAARALRSHGRDAASAQGVENKMRAARIIAERVESTVGRSLEEIVGRGSAAHG